MSNQTTIKQQVARRRSFAIIAHPDAGKTTLTEKLLLFGGAINLAGEVKAKRAKIQTRSDWMALERERGISVATSVMTFEYQDCVFNLLDTPGHEDFADDTYRTLSAVDSAIMVLDAAKGIEPRTLKLFEVCRMRDIPIITFVNKMDREARAPLDILDEIEQKLALDAVPINLPIGQGRQFRGTYNLQHNFIRTGDSQPIEQLSPDAIGRKIHQMQLDNFATDLFSETLEMVQGLCKNFDEAAYKQGHMTPVFFGSALRDMGLIDLIDALVQYSPSPSAAASMQRSVEPHEETLSGFIFKIQANMDPNHRSSLAFMRISSGVLKRGMRLNIVQTGKNINLAAPQFFFGARRALAEQAFAGDVVGLPNSGNLAIGYSLTEGEKLEFLGVPHFAPQILRNIRTSNSLKAKNLKEALKALAFEGAVQLFFPENGETLIIGVIGALQLDVLEARLASEYNVDAKLESSRFNICRWVRGAGANSFAALHKNDMARDNSGALVFLASSLFSLDYEIQRAKKSTLDGAALDGAALDIEFLDVKPL